MSVQGNRKEPRAEKRCMLRDFKDVDVAGQK